ncbi:leucine carboxyl methyltransferase [Tieghemostelium lacteum]|uniref:Leucine carboxyl methyltransferase 1 n=1 Tax=Tieghemostelium lacteum TaxID=361077 RepID=A0A152A0R3_TIELA|nr:leucine carboxyl methyltransferase [Tieghemostelium lacteum]|eukprot:KYQ99815.1 leucine carboxyl methyltransferase [Tieghemostelium lacteum]
MDNNKIPPLSSFTSKKTIAPKRAVDHFSMKQGQKESIISTNDDAASCKLSAVDKGYYIDDFVKHFVKVPIKRPPLINRGFFSRVEAIEQFIKQFFTSYSQERKQIVSLGCGFDTLYFRLKKRGDTQNLVFFEVDYEEVVKNKIKIIKAQKELYQMIDQEWSQKLSGDYSSNVKINSPYYRLGCIDLKSLETFEIFDQLGIDYNLPTLFLSECVLIYIPTECGNNTIHWASSKFTESLFITYEQIKPSDEFGQMMLKNIEIKGCPLLSIQSFPEIKDQKKRYLDKGWNRVDVLDMRDVYNYFIDKNRIKETERLEIFDEFEEWDLIQTHYCYVLAIKSSQHLNDFNFENTKPLNSNNNNNNSINNKFIS